MMWIRRAGRGGLVTAAILAALSCGGDDGPVTPGSIQLGLSAATVSVPRGASGSVTATVTRNAGYTGEVVIAVSGQPAGVNPIVDPVVLLGLTATSANVTIGVGSDVPLGTYTVTVTATGPRVSPVTASLQLTVTPTPDFALTVTPASLGIPAGASGSVTVNIERTNFTESVALSLIDAPSGVTSTFDPTLAGSNTSTLLVSVAATVAPGTYTLTVQGNSPTVFRRTTTFTLEVTPPTSGVRVEYAFCDSESTPAFVAYQDGSGAWQAVTGTTSDGATIFGFDIAQGRGGVMFVYEAAEPNVANAIRVGGTRLARRATPYRSRFRDLVWRRGLPGTTWPSMRARASLADLYDTVIIYASTDELVADAEVSCVPPEATKTVTGTVAGVAAGQYGVVSLGFSTTYFDGAASSNPVTFTDVPDGPVDFVGSRIVKPGLAPDKVIVFRNLNVPDGGALPSTIDFNGAATSAPAVSNATITGASGTDQLEIFVEAVTANSHLLLWSDLAPSSTAVRPWAGLGPSVMATGDFHGLLTFASAPGTGLNFRVTGKYVGPVSPQSLALGPVLPAPAISQVAAGAYPRYRFQGTFAADYNKTAYIEITSDGNRSSILATGAYLNASGSPLSYDFVTPDVAGLTGFPVASRLTAGANDVTVSVLGFSGPGIFDQLPAVGREFKGATRGATITVP